MGFPAEAHHRDAQPGGPSCATCKNFGRGMCSLYGAATQPAQLCDGYTAAAGAQRAIATRSSRYTDAASGAPVNIPTG